MKYFAAILALCALCSCQAFHIDEILNRAERQLTDAPDSALVTMQSIRRYALLCPKVRARYGVVYSAALDKNYVDVTTDSLIRYSASYYDLHGTAEERMRAYYYLGRVYENAKDYQQALLYYLDAAQYTESVEDNYLKGLLYSNLGEMYEQYYNYDKAYEYFELSYNCFKLIDLRRHQAYQLYKMAEKCWKNYPENAISFLNRAITLAGDANYQGILPLCYDELLFIYVSLQQYDKALEISKKIDVDGCRFVRTSGALSELFAYKYQFRKSDELLQRGWSYSVDKVDSSYMFNTLSRVYLLRGMYYESTVNHNYALKLQLALAVQDMGGTIAAIERKYLSDKMMLQKQKVQKQKVIYLAVSILIFLVIAIVAIHLHTKNKKEIIKKDNQINQYLLSVQSLHSELAERDEKLKEVSSEIFGEAFKAIDELCCTYFEYSDNPKQQSAILNHVKGLIGNISSKSYLVQLEEQINGCYDNILEKLKSDFPMLSENEYMLSCYLCAGFTTQAICLFLNCNSSAVYNRISRLRKKIKDSTSENKELFLKYL
ncbi:MAG: tetratricopeptide repeat protein [Rikenellaceae bacterium]|nr:tetratricopeptide repeat protein [Rikenellaceae bacterium]